MKNAPANGVNPRVTQRIRENEVAAALTEVEGRWQLTMIRDLPHPANRVWPMLTDPAQLARWSPVVPDRALDSPGPALSREQLTATPVDTEVLAADPPRLLVHRWGSHLLRWTLEPTAEGCRLTLQQVLDTPRDPRGPQPAIGPGRPPVYAAGWHVCLAVLAVVLDTTTPSTPASECAPSDPERVVGRRAMAYGWQSLRDDYGRLLG